MAEVDDDAFEAVLANLRDNVPPVREAALTEHVTALLALALRAEGRFDQLAAVLPSDPSVRSAQQTLRQLQQRANGPLQSELELVWQAVAPPEKR